MKLSFRSAATPFAASLEDVCLPQWEPSPAQMQSFKARDLEHAMTNVAGVLRNATPRRLETLTNGLEEGKGYHAIGVVKGGPEADETLHNPHTFARAVSLLAEGACLDDEAVTVVNVSADASLSRSDPERKKMVTIYNRRRAGHAASADKKRLAGATLRPKAAIIGAISVIVGLTALVGSASAVSCYTGETGHPGKDGKDGTPGVPGSAGDAGPTGPAGPGFDASDNRPRIVFSTHNGLGSATCPVGAYLTGGACWATSLGVGNAGRPDGNGWKCDDASATAFAFCAEEQT